jgi:5-methylthioribose kinase
MLTNSSGIAYFPSVQEGRYQLTVQHIGHGNFRSILIIEDIGTNITVFIPKQVVSYSWVVVPTEIEDKYVFVLEATFETNVPIPGLSHTHTYTYTQKHNVCSCLTYILYFSNHRRTFLDQHG